MAKMIQPRSNAIYQCKIFDSGQILTPVCRLAWLSVDKPTAIMGDEKKLRFQATLLFDTSQADVTPIISAAEALAVKTFGKTYDRIRDFKMPLKDGAEKGDLDGYGEGIWYIDTKSLYAPKLFNRDRSFADPSIFYAGCYARAVGNLYAYRPSKAFPASKSGIAFGFSALQFVNDGEPFGGGAIDPDMLDALD
jgi:hypothetical protein